MALKREEMDGVGEMGGGEVESTSEQDAESASPSASRPPQEARGEESASFGINIPFDAHQAALTLYPPSCPVIHTDATKKPPAVTFGKVKSVSFNMASKEFLYHVTTTQGSTENTILALENQLSFAPLCTVEIKISDESGSTTTSATVLTSYQPIPSSEVLYSLQKDSGTVLHGISKDCIKYRNVHSSLNPSDTILIPNTNSAASASRTDQSDPTATSATSPPMRKRPLISEGQQEDVAAKYSTSNDEPAVKRARALNGSYASLASANDTARSTVSDIGFNERVYEAQSVAHASTLAAGKVSVGGGELPSRRQPFESDSGDDTDLYESKLVIPSTVFDEHEVKEFFKTNSSRIMQETQCHIRWNVGGKNGKNSNVQMSVKLRGKRRLVDIAVFTLEESLLSMLDFEDKGRALYYFAFLNDHRFSTEIDGYRIVYQLCCHQNKKAMRYMHCRKLPSDFSDILAITIGAQGSNKKRIMKRTKCNIEINPKSHVPHYVVYGESADDVVKGVQEMETSLAEARALTRRPKRRHRR